jgi:hypothetical protein
MKRFAILLFSAVISCGSSKEEDTANKNAMQWIQENLPQSKLLVCYWKDLTAYSCQIIYQNRMHSIECNSNPNNNATCWASEDVIKLIRLSPSPEKQ